MLSGCTDNTGFKPAAEEELPQATAVMDPFHVIRLAGDAVEKCRRRIQLKTLGHRGRKQDPLYKARRTLLTGADLLTDKQYDRIQDVFDGDAHVEVEATWAFYQHMVAAYREPDRAQGKQIMQKVITKLSRAVPKALTELTTLGRTLKNRAEDILAYFDRPGTSNGPTEAINGRLEHLRGSALGFRNLTNYIARSLLEFRRIQNPTTPSIVKSLFFFPMDTKAELTSAFDGRLESMAGSHAELTSLLRGEVDDEFEILSDIAAFTSINGIGSESTDLVIRALEENQ